MNAIAARHGIYSVGDAAMLTQVAPRQIRGWLLGYGQKRSKQRPEPIIHRQHIAEDGELALGFLDLLEIAFLGKIVHVAARRGHALSWKAIRVAAETARRRFGTPHPFAVRRIHTDGRAILVETQQETGDKALYDLLGDNFAIYDVLSDSFVASVEYEGDMPRRWTPDDRNSRIVLDPLRSFGRPVDQPSGVPAEAMFDAWKAEQGDALKVAAWFEVDREAVEQAVAFTLGLGRARRSA